MDAYQPCPCGSGKKFKWCCQPFYGEILHAEQLRQNNQQEAALAVLHKLTQEHPGSTAVWGRYSEFLWAADRREEAETALDKAMELNPRYAHGYFLRATFRHDERDTEAALGLYRKAAELAPAEDASLRASICTNLAQIEMMQQRPMAALAALDIAQRLAPDDQHIRDMANRYFGVESRVPAFLRRRHALQPLPADAPASLRQSWQAALQAGATGRLPDARKAFETLALSQPHVAAVHWNLALVRAWLGDNAKAIEALDAFVRLEKDETRAAEAWELAEGLRSANGMEGQCDLFQTTHTYEAAHGGELLQRASRDPRFVEWQTRENLAVAIWLDRPMPAASENLALYELPWVAALVIFGPNGVQLSNVKSERLEKAKAEFEAAYGNQVRLVKTEVSAASFGMQAAAVLNFRLPSGLATGQASSLLTRHVQQHFMEDWWQHPLKSLDGRTPAEAATRPTGRKKVLGLIRFWESIFNASAAHVFDFEQMRSHLASIPLDPQAPPDDLPPARDFSQLGADELRGLTPEVLPDAELAAAYRAAQRLHEPALVRQFGQALLDRPGCGGMEPFLLCQQLVLGSLQAGQPDQARHWLTAASKHDDGKRQVDVDLLRARVSVAEGKSSEAYEVFVGLLRRQPANLDVAGAAAEQMLKLGQRSQAAQFAEHGLGYARAQGDRDRQAFFSDLLKAAKKA